MKKIAFCAMVTAIVLLASVSAPAQENSMAVGAGFDVMLPVASFGDQWSTGFGGTAQFDYAVTTHTTPGVGSNPTTRQRLLPISLPHTAVFRFSWVSSIILTFS